MIITDAVMDPHAMLDITQQVEQQVGQGAPHRNPDGTYRDRPIDIDIIDIDSITLNTPRLILPHPGHTCAASSPSPCTSLKKNTSPDTCKPCGV